MTFATTAEAGGGAALTMQREANHWVNNEAALVECDPELIPTVGGAAGRNVISTRPCIFI
jgi:hypothetical protein